MGQLAARRIGNDAIAQFGLPRWSRGWSLQNGCNGYGLMSIGRQTTT